MIYKLQSQGRHGQTALYAKISCLPLQDPAPSSLELETLLNQRRPTAPDILGGFFVPGSHPVAQKVHSVFVRLRGQLACPGRKPKTRRPDLWRVFHPRSFGRLKHALAPAIAIAAKGAST
ncbi:MAG: hypothetical protein H7839_21340 [Magnetococcus sp. YQC-5]